MRQRTPYHDWNSAFDEPMRVLRGALPAHLIPADPSARAKLVADLVDSGALDQAKRRRLDLADVTDGTSVVETEAARVREAECGDTSEDAQVRGGLLRLSNFHLGLGGDEEGEIGGAAGEGAVVPAEFGMKDTTFELGGFQRYPEQWMLAKRDDRIPESGPLRQDGTDKQERDEKYYGHAWREEWFERQKIKEADPWYQLLVDIAGGTNTTVDRLQTVQNIEAREMSWRVYAQRQAAAVQTQFKEYRTVVKRIAETEKAIKAEEAKRPSAAKFQRASELSTNAVVRIDSGAVSLAAAVWKRRYFQLFARVLAPVLNPDTLVARDMWAAVKVQKGDHAEEKARYLADVRELLEMIRRPRTTARGLVETLDAPDEEQRRRIGLSAGGREPTARGARPFQTPIFASDYAKALVESSEADDQSTWARIHTNATALQALPDATDTGADDATHITAKIRYLLMYYGAERGMLFPAGGGGGGISPADRAKMVAGVAFPSTTGIRLESEVSQRYGEAIRENNPSLFAGATAAPAQDDLDRMVQQHQFSVQAQDEGLRDEISNAWVFLLRVEDDVLQMAERGARGRAELLRSSLAVRMAEARAAAGPIQVLQLAGGDVHDALRLFERLGERPADESVERKIAQLQDERTELEVRANALAREATGSGARPEETPYLPDPQWVLRPEFTGRMSMQPIVRNAINQAYTLVKRYAPQAVGGLSDDAGLERLVTNDTLRPYFVELIVMWMYRTRHRFQVRWLPPAQGEAVRSARVALQGLRTHGAPGRARSTWALRTPTPAEVCGIAATVPRGLVYDRGASTL